MKRSEIKVGETYGVRYGSFSGHGSEPVPAKVVAVDEPVEWATPGYTNISNRRKDGGVRVEFAEPTRVSSQGFHLAAKTNENAGKVQSGFVFHDDLPRCGGSVGKCFVGLWSELENARKAETRVLRERKETFKKQADEFAPVLAAYVKRLKKIGLPVDAYGDGSGLHGPVSVELYSTGYENGNRPCGFGYRASLPVEIFNQLVEIAERHGEKIKVSR